MTVFEAVDRFNNAESLMDYLKSKTPEGTEIVEITATDAERILQIVENYICLLGNQRLDTDYTYHRWYDVQKEETK